jgi:hypothetical protein
MQACKVEGFCAQGRYEQLSKTSSQKTKIKTKQKENKYNEQKSYKQGKLFNYINHHLKCSLLIPIKRQIFRVYVVEILYTRVCKWKNETC